MSEKFKIEEHTYSRFSFQRNERVLSAAFDSDHPVNRVNGPMHEELALMRYPMLMTWHAMFDIFWACRLQGGSSDMQRNKLASLMEL